MIKKLHDNAYRGRDAEEARRFCEDFVGLPLAFALDVGPGRLMHTFIALGDGSFLAFLMT
jgi:hypothetical protein